MKKLTLYFYKFYLSYNVKNIPSDKLYNYISNSESHTPYTAPEIIMRQQPTSASDYYSLGLILYEMMVGKKSYL